MSVRRRSFLVLLGVLAALLAVPGAALAAKAKTRVVPAETMAILHVRGSNGWTFQISGIATGDHPIGGFAKGPHHEEVDYEGFRSHFGRDGTIEAKLPGVGHIDLR